MNAKRTLRWVIVLFLLAALPGLTAVMAQGQAPTGPEPADLYDILWASTETEPNNSIAAADEFRTVQGGMFDGPGDVDFYEIYALNWEYGAVADTNSPILIEIMSGWGWHCHCVIKLWAPDGTLLDTATYLGNDNRDPLLYYNLESGSPANPVYYLSIEPGAGGYGQEYLVLISNPLLISAAAANLGKASVSGISFQAGDVLAWSEFEVDGTTYEKWNMLLDLSDLGVKGNLTNLAGGWRNSDFLLLGFAANITLPGVAEVVKPADVVLFDPSQVGPNTTGTFQLWWRGSDHQLTTTAEKLDAIDWPNWGGAFRLYASTTGTAAVTKSGGGVLKLADEDIGLWGPQNIWERYFDHSVVAGMGAEDVIALTIADEYWTYDMTWQVKYHFYNVVVLGSTQCLSLIHI